MRRGTVAFGRPVRWLALLAAVVCAISLFRLPYHIAVTPSISLSYVTGFNNHAALLLFFAACGLFCVATGGTPWVLRLRDGKLSPWWLLIVAGLGLALAIVWRRHHAGLGTESRYLVDRQIHVADGARLYRDVEYIYGPLLILPGVWLQRYAGVTAVQAYMFLWMATFVAGIGMLWFVVRYLDLPNSRRWIVFALLGGTSIYWLQGEGLQYTPLRGCYAAFCATAIALYWRRSRNDMSTAGFMGLAIAFGFGISPEQGIGLALGLPAYAFLLSWTSPRHFRWRATAGVAAASVVCTGLALWTGEFLSTSGVAEGGLNFPLLASPVNLFLLSIYVVAFLTLYALFRNKAWDSVAIPLGLCGIPMMSSAFGRCDPGHLESVLPLYVIGLFWMTAQRWTVLPWAVLAGMFLVPTAELQIRLRTLQHPSPAKVSQPVTHAAPVHPTGVPIPTGPAYFAPFAVPTGEDGRPRWGATTGRFYGLQDVLTLADERYKIKELQTRKSPFLLLQDLPDAPVVAFWSSEENVDEVKGFEGSSWGPPARHTLPLKADLRAAITAMYEPTQFREEGWRVWKLRQASAQ